MIHINQYGNVYDMTPLLIEGGQDETYYKVVHASDNLINFTDYPSINDGKQLHFKFGWSDDEAKEYWSHKVTRNRLAVQLTVTGNAVSCESALVRCGYNAHAINPTTVIVILPDAHPSTEQS